MKLSQASQIRYIEFRKAVNDWKKQYVLAHNASFHKKRKAERINKNAKESSLTD